MRPPMHGTCWVQSLKQSRGHPGSQLCLRRPRSCPRGFLQQGPARAGSSLVSLVAPQACVLKACQWFREGRLNQV